MAWPLSLVEDPHVEPGASRGFWHGEISALSKPTTVRLVRAD
jgi:hypothetical protein